MITQILVYILLVYGISFGLVYSRGLFGIFFYIRKILSYISKEFEQMFECMFCTSCNIGLWLSIINLFIIPTTPFTIGMLIFNDPNLWYLILPIDIFVTSSCVFLIDTIQTYLENNAKS